MNIETQPTKTIERKNFMKMNLEIISRPLSLQSQSS
jgi:hypothetical protein